MSEETHMTPGITGYRRYGCRCSDCSAAGAKWNANRREMERERGRQRRAGKPTKPRIPPVTEVDWSEIEYLKPGYRRTKP